MISSGQIVMILLSGIPFFSVAQNAAYSQLTQENQHKKVNIRDSTDLKNILKNGQLLISGYSQFFFENNQSDLVDNFNAVNSFYIRRARIKFTYETLDMFKFVLQPDFSKGSFILKDSYVEMSFQKIKNFTFSAGRFKRPNYKFESSSDEKGILERPMILKNVFPDQRDIGIKVNYDGIKIPLNLQIALMNGNIDETMTIDVDTKKDIMALAMYSISTEASKFRTDIGINTYFGNLRVKSSNYVIRDDGNQDSSCLGTYLERRWISYAINMFFNFLGGTLIKCEFIKGINAYDYYTPEGVFKYKMRSFAGFYTSLAKNIGSKNQIIIRYDFIDPNIRVYRTTVLEDMIFKKMAFSWEYHMNRNLDFGISYEVTANGKNNKFRNDLDGNILRLMIQTKF